MRAAAAGQRLSAALAAQKQLHESKQKLSEILAEERAQRTQLAAENAALLSKVETLHADSSGVRNSLVAETGRLEMRCAGLEQERARLVQERDSQASQRSHLTQQLDAMQAESAAQAQQVLMSG